MGFEDESFDIAMSHHYDEQSKNVPMCQEKGCQNPSIQCEIDEMHEYFCSEHAAKNGYCYCCGTFIAGLRDLSDICENCEEQFHDDIDDLSDIDEPF
ncbi:hypothetical protein KAR91_70570 [Candidatus Pacearchaeota archaeon]|nr:hypothetical protein [Candidatus Pacearchaeota archaeon]